MALVLCDNPCPQVCVNGHCTPCSDANANPNCFVHDNKWYDITKLDCSECQQYATTEIGKASCMSMCQNPAGFDEEQLGLAAQQAKEKNKKIAIVSIVVIVIIVLMFLLFLKDKK